MQAIIYQTLCLDLNWILEKNCGEGKEINYIKYYYIVVWICGILPGHIKTIQLEYKN